MHLNVNEIIFPVFTFFRLKYDSLHDTMEYLIQINNILKYNKVFH